MQGSKNPRGGANFPSWGWGRGLTSSAAGVVPFEVRRTGLPQVSSTRQAGKGLGWGGASHTANWAQISRF